MFANEEKDCPAVANSSSYLKGGPQEFGEFFRTRG